MSEKGSWASTYNQRKYAVFLSVVAFFLLVGGRFTTPILDYPVITIGEGALTIGILMAIAMLYIAQGLYRNKF